MSFTSTSQSICEALGGKDWKWNGEWEDDQADQADQADQDWKRRKVSDSAISRWQDRNCQCHTASHTEVTEVLQDAACCEMGNVL